MDFWSRKIGCLAGAACVCVALLLLSDRAEGQSFGYEAKPKVGSARLSYSDPDPAPRMMQPSEAADFPCAPVDLTVRWQDRYADQRLQGGDDRARKGYDFDARLAQYRARVYRDGSPTLAPEPIPDSGIDGPVVDQLPPNVSLAPPPIGLPYGEAQSADGPYDGGPCQNDDGCQACPQGFCDRMHAWAHNCWFFSPEIWRNFNEFSGVQAFKGPVDRGVNGNFGFQKGVNWANPLWDDLGLGFQLGGLIALSDFDGGAGIVNHGRDQYFVTSGLFHRPRCNQGWQGGAVLDFLHDQFYVDMNLWQVRFEISYLFREHEVGVWSSVHANSDTKPAPASFNQANTTWQANDQYNLFYRRRFANGGIGRMWIGLTNFADIMFGGDATAPLSERWAIQASYNYLAPSLNPTIPNAIKETWGIQIALVWYPDCKVPSACFNPYRPLFNVADNGWLMIREKN